MTDFTRLDESCLLRNGENGDRLEGEESHDRHNIAVYINTTLRLRGISHYLPQETSASIGSLKYRTPCSCFVSMALECMS